MFSKLEILSWSFLAPLVIDMHCTQLYLVSKWPAKPEDYCDIGSWCLGAGVKAQNQVLLKQCWIFNDFAESIVRWGIVLTPMSILKGNPYPFEWGKRLTYSCCVSHEPANQREQPMCRFQTSTFNMVCSARDTSLFQQDFRAKSLSFELSCCDSHKNVLLVRSCSYIFYGWQRH